MRLAIILFVLFSSSSLFAQTGDSNITKTQDNTRYVAPRNATGTFELKKENDLYQLVSQYQVAANDHKPDLKKRIYSVLHEILELKISRKEAELQVLSAELTSLEQSATPQDHVARIETLRKGINAVNQSLSYRRQNKEKIVKSRMIELIGE